MKEQLTYAQRNGPTDPATLKECRACREWKAITCFHRARFNLYGVSHECKDCSRVRIRHSHRLRSYGVNAEDYARMLEAQGGGCKLCGKPGAEVKWANKPSELEVDHCHRSGVIRGLLCSRCNSKLVVVDDPLWDEWLVKARAYLSRH